MSDTGIVLATLGAFFVILCVLGAQRTRNRKEALVMRLVSEYGRLPDRTYSPSECARIPRYHEMHRDAAAFSIDSITAGDLDIWHLFTRMDYCHSAAGEEVLYHLLSTPCQEQARLLAREEEMGVYAGNETLRTSLAFTFYQLGGSGKTSVYDYLDLLESAKVKSNAVHIAGIAALILSLFIFPFSVPVGFVLFLLVCAFQVVTYYRVRSETDAYLSTFSYILRLIGCGREVLDIFAKKEEGSFEEPEALKVRKERIATCLQTLADFARGSFVLVNSSRMSGSGNPFDIVADYFRILTHADLMKFNQMIRQIGAKEVYVDALITQLGEIEALISVCSYRAYLASEEGTGYCVPDFDEPSHCALSVRDLVHPLLGKAAVPNSMAAERPVLFTGSNASGKSTWLKAIGLAALMAQTIHTVCAVSYRAPLFRIYSSMALTDDLLAGESYYVVEIRSLQRMLAAAARQDAAPVLAFVDEVLRGTNTPERIAASAQILKAFAGMPALLFAATHDLELTRLLAGEYDNRHFEGTLADGDVRFDYTLKNGPSTERNAIGLLKAFSFDDALTEQAERMASRFMETGIWSME